MAELDLTQMREDIDAEVARATEKERILQSDIDAEVARATEKERMLGNELNAEIEARKAADKSTVSEIKEYVENGNYCTLGVGTEIAGGADLNSYVTPGVYDVHSTETAKTIKNIPAQKYGFLTVRLVSDVVFQTFTHPSTGESWSRQRKDDYLGPWWTNWSLNSGVDAITAIGTSGAWRYIKFASGIAIVQFLGGRSIEGAREWTAYTVGTGVHYDIKANLPFRMRYCTACGANSYSRYTHCGVSGSAIENELSTEINFAWSNSHSTTTSVDSSLTATVIGLWI